MLEAKDTKKSEAKAKNSLSEERHSQGQEQECLRPRPARTQAQVLSKQTYKKSLHKNFSGNLKKKKKSLFQAFSTKKRFRKNFSSVPQNFNNSKNIAVLEPRTDQLSRT